VAPPKILVATAVLVLVLATRTASAAEVAAELETPDGVRYGAQTVVAGQLTEGGVPLPAQPVVLDARRHPYRTDWRPLASATTDADGRFEIARELDRNHELRVRHETTGVLSPALSAFVFPSFTLAFEELRPGAIRITQTYRVPRDVRLRAPTRFYLGPQSRRRARLRAVAPTRRVRPGRYRAVARVRIPRSYGGRFRYVSCFPYTRGSGMGDPSRRCPRRVFRVG
jgi:hypothetical protein